jgi:hypothetical protein
MMAEIPLEAYIEDEDYGSALREIKTRVDKVSEELEQVVKSIDSQDQIMAELMLLVAQIIPQLEALITHMISANPEQEEAILKKLESNKKMVLDMLIEANKQRSDDA